MTSFATSLKNTGEYITWNSFDEVTPSLVTTGSAVFNGTSQYLTVPASTAFAFGTNNLTIESWCYFSNGTTNITGVICSNYGPSSSWATDSFYFGKHTSYSGKVTFWIYNYNSSGALLVDPTLPPDNVWTHYAVTRYGSTWTLWRNGVSVTTGTYSGNPNATKTNLLIGESDINTNYFYGHLSNFRIVKGTALYTTNFTPLFPLTAVTDTQLILNTPKNSNFLIDSSVNKFVITNNGGVTSSTVAPVITSAVIQITTSVVYAKEFDEITLNPLASGLAKRENINGTLQVGGFFNERPEELLLTAAGTYTFTVPDYVTSLTIVAVGGGGGTVAGTEGMVQSGASGAGGGALAYISTLTVTPGEELIVTVGAGGLGVPDDSVAAQTDGTSSTVYRSNTLLLFAGGGKKGVANSTTSNPGGVGGTWGGTAVTGGGNGGDGGNCNGDSGGGGGGGGTGGYGGNGGAGGQARTTSGLIQVATTGTNGTLGAGGGGGGGTTTVTGGGSGGGVGIYGRGSDGLGGSTSTATARGLGGSGGDNGQNPGNGTGFGGLFGGGGSGGGDSPGTVTAGAAGGGNGAVRILWAVGAAYPTTNLGNTL